VRVGPPYERVNSRIRVWLAKLQPDTQKPFLELFGQPRARGEATDEECGLPPGCQEQDLTSFKYANRIGSKASVEVILDGVHGGLDRGFEEPGDLCAVCVKVCVDLLIEWVRVYPVNDNLPVLIPKFGSLSQWDQI